MHSLYLVRHAKSSWSNPGLDDRDRPLNSRGKEDAPKMGKLLLKKGEIPDLMISSPAKRAFSAAKRIAKELDYPLKRIKKSEALYMAGDEDYFSVIRDVPKDVYKLMLFSHNYGITGFANYISGSDIDNIPTSGIVRIDFDIDSWKDITEYLKTKKGKLIYFEYPKKYPDGV